MKINRPLVKRLSPWALLVITALVCGSLLGFKAQSKCGLFESCLLSTALDCQWQTPPPLDFEREYHWHRHDEDGLCQGNYHWVKYWCCPPSSLTENGRDDEWAPADAHVNEPIPACAL